MMVTKVVSLGLFLLFIAVSASAQTNTSDYLTITTYYPSPYGVYGTLRLHPKKMPAGCSEGEMTYHLDPVDPSTKGLYVCDGADWQPIPKMQSERRPLGNIMAVDEQYEYSMSFPRQNYFNKPPVIIGQIEVHKPVSGWPYYWRMTDPKQDSSGFQVFFGFRNITINGFVLTVKYYNATIAQGWQDWWFDYIAVEP